MMRDPLAECNRPRPLMRRPSPLVCPSHSPELAERLIPYLFPGSDRRRADHPALPTAAPPVRPGSRIRRTNEGCTDQSQLPWDVWQRCLETWKGDTKIDCRHRAKTIRCRDLPKCRRGSGYSDGCRLGPVPFLADCYPSAALLPLPGNGPESAVGVPDDELSHGPEVRVILGLTSRSCSGTTLR